MLEATTTLERNIRAAIAQAKRSGTTGMSIANLKQVTSTKGLMCTPAVYHLAFAVAVAKISVRGFRIYS